MIITCGGKRLCIKTKVNNLIFETLKIIVQGRVYFRLDP